jgi:putative solute:sodium symporter small subunit
METGKNTINPSVGVIDGKEDVVDASVDRLIKKQWNFSALLTLIVLIPIFLIPVLNEFATDLMTTKVFGGFSLSYFLIAFGVYPFVWAITIYYTKKSIKIEEDME